MARRNPTTTTPGGRARKTRMSVAVKRLAQPLNIDVVASRDGGADVTFTMRNGDTIVVAAPNTHVAMDWLQHLYGEAANDRRGRPVAMEATVNGATFAIGTTTWARLFERYLPYEDPDRNLAGWYMRAAHQLMRVWTGPLQQLQNGDAIARVAAARLGDAVEAAWRKTFARPNATLVADVVLSAFVEPLGGYGVEELVASTGSVAAVFVNTGDTYSQTLLWDRQYNQWNLTSWGDFVEDTEASGRYTFE